MKWSWRIGRFAGIDTDVHASFLLLLAWVGFSTYRDAGAWSVVLYALSFVIALFASVVLHELGHALTARRFGIRTRRILLLPIGGMAQLERSPKKPVQEFSIAIAGPLVSFALAAGLWLGESVLTPVLGTSESAAILLAFVGSLKWANLMLGAFNLLPAFPMDGGRVFRALLARKLPYVRATDIAARIGKTAAVAFGVFGLLYDPMLMLLGVFLWFAAHTEQRGSKLAAQHTRPDVVAQWVDADGRIVYVMRAQPPGSRPLPSDLG